MDGVGVVVCIKTLLPFISTSFLSVFFPGKIKDKHKENLRFLILVKIPNYQFFIHYLW